MISAPEQNAPPLPLALLGLKFRKKGIGEKIISHLIDQAKQIGIKKLSIESGAGEFFSPARKLFQKFGFKACKPFAHYKEDLNSCYFSLNISK